MRRRATKNSDTMTSSFDGALVPDRRHDYVESVVAGTYLWTGATRRGRAADAGQLRITICSAFWTALQRFVENGRLAIDNNRAENQLRVVAVGRKNWLFAGSFEGARRAALLYSLVQSCKLVDVSPFDYLKDILLRIATHPQRLVD